MSTYALPTRSATQRDPRDDGALVRDRLRGHDEAFAVFYRRHHRRLVGYCLRRTQNEALAEDLAHDTLIKALESLDEYDLDRPAWPWLKAIAHNTMIDHIRKHKREDLMERPVAEDAAVEDDLTELLAERPILAEAMSELPDRQRAAVRLRYLEDWKASEAGDFLDLSRPAVEQLLHRARKNLRDTYERLVDETAGRLAGLLIPLYRLKDSLTARFRARLNGWEFNLQAIGPAAMDVIGQTAATLALLGLAAAVAGGSSTEKAWVQIGASFDGGASTSETVVTKTEPANQARGDFLTSRSHDDASGPAPRVIIESPRTEALDTASTQQHATLTTEPEEWSLHSTVESRVGPWDPPARVDVVLRCDGSVVLDTVCDIGEEG